MQNPFKLIKIMGCAAIFAAIIIAQLPDKKKGENVLISPISILAALAMTANGAKGETLTQMEQVFGVNMYRLNE